MGTGIRKLKEKCAVTFKTIEKILMWCKTWWEESERDDDRLDDNLKNTIIYQL